MYILVCDDDAGASESLIKLIYDELKELKLTASVLSFSNSDDLFDWLKSNTAALIFLDIQLNSENGIDIAREINRIQPELSVVYVTGYSDFAGQICLSRFESFLLKPVDKEKFRFVFRRVMKDIELKTNFIHLKAGSSLVSLDTRKIMYAESYHRQIIVHCCDETREYYYKISDLMTVLPNNFVQIHKSYIVNMDLIQSVKSAQITLRDRTVLPLSQKKSTEFKKTYMDYLGM